MTNHPKRAYFRSIVFNLCFYAVTGVMCFLYLLLLPLPRAYFLAAIDFWLNVVLFLEKYILGLNYEIRGLENLPKDGAYIVAAKHQSAYETLKLHKLFKDPAIILKQELLKIPLWGLYLKKADPIAIDRSSPGAARESINTGALRMKAQGRPIIIFPQGTRVRPETTSKEKPYKSGIHGIQDASGLPIIPLALNTGAFWPRNDFFKSSGTVIFEFLPAIQPGKTKQELMQMIENHVEAKTKILTEEAVAEVSKQDRKMLKYWLMLFVFIAALFAAYSYAWFEAADRIKLEYYKTLLNITDDQTRLETMTVSGYPGMINLSVPEETLVTAHGQATLQNIKAVGWVFPGLPVHIEAGPVRIRDIKWQAPLLFDHVDASVKFKRRGVVEIINSEIKQNAFVAKTAGTIDTAQEPIPKLDLNVAFINHQDLLGDLAKNKIIETRMALFLGLGLAGLADENNVVTVPLVQRDNTLYIDAIPILQVRPPQEIIEEPLTPSSPLQLPLQPESYIPPAPDQ